MTDQDRLAFDWTSIEAQDWKTFLGSKTGQKLLAGLALEEPELLDGSHTERTLVRSGEVRQHRVILAFLLSLINETPKPSYDPTAESYPSLYDDRKWDDNQKLNP